MQAHEQLLLSLVGTQSWRFVVPVYQRPYSWDEEQCAQLWDDILATGRGNGATHFTGSVVWVQDGTLNPSGVTPILLIDGQQRITTLTLLLIALYRYSQEHSESGLAFRWEEIRDRGYLFDQYREGDDRYELTLSQGDRDTLRSLVDNLSNPDVKIVEDSDRLLDNLSFFETRLNGLEDPNIVWAGIQRLEIVSISLTQGQDNPQLIFESMNSTGKDLSSADLIRNFVLMGQVNQDDLYLTYWRPIEKTLGASTYDEVFDEFIRAYLTCINATSTLTRRDVYDVFKRHFETGNFGKTVPVENLLKELQRFAGYYSAISSGAADDSEAKHFLDRIAKLDASVATPLLMSFLDDYDHTAFSHDDLITLLATTESYLFRRAVCYGSSQGLNKFFPSLIGRLNHVQDEGGNYVEAYQAMLLNETATARRFPRDAEFETALKTRDSYNFRRSLFMLTALENSYHPKDERDFSTGKYTIEHIMPQNALAHEEWRKMVGDVSEEEFEQLVHNLGNLTLTAYNSELSDGTFQEKKDRAVGGYDVEYITISNDLRNAIEWTPASIAARADQLVSRAVELWAMPSIDEAVRKQYQPERKVGKRRKVIAFKDVFDAGLIKAGDKLISTSTIAPGEAIVTEEGTIKLAGGDEFTSPSLAIINQIKKAGGSSGARNGWHCWKLNSEDGQLIDELRAQIDESSVTQDDNDWRVMCGLFWGDFYDRCAESQTFVEALGDPSTRADNLANWTDFGIGRSDCHLSLRFNTFKNHIEAGVWFPSGENYEKLYAKRSEIENNFDGSSDKFIWVEPESSRKTRAFWIQKQFELDTQDWNEAYDWFISTLQFLRVEALRVLG